MVNERGVSEIIGAILLVSLVILGVTIVAVLLLSQPLPQEIPQVNAVAGNNTSYIFLRHDGGDTLESFETIIRIDGKPDPVPANDITLIDENGNSITPWTSGQWSVGSTLVIKDNETPKSVSMVYTGGSSQVLLLTATFVDTIPNVIPPLPPGFYHIITTSAGSGGSISPPGPVQVQDGGSQTFSINPDPCYRITGVLVDGSPVGAVSTYTFTNVRNDHTISATFAENSLSITASAGTGGTINPSGTVIASCHGSQTFTVTNSSGYWIQDVLVDESSVGAVPSYTFNNIVINHTISASFTNVAPCTPVTANFSGSPTSGPVPLNVQFTDSSTGNPTAWAWNFGDGSPISNLQNPLHQYTSSGSFTVSLNVSNNCSSQTMTRSSYISTTCSSSEDDADRVYPRCGSCQVLLNGSCQVSLGYLNDNAYCVQISIFNPVGNAKNEFTGSTKDRGQPTIFNTGLNVPVYTVIFTENNMQWKLGSTGPSHALDLSCKGVCNCTNP